MCIRDRHCTANYENTRCKWHHGLLTPQHTRSRSNNPHESTAKKSEIPKKKEREREKEEEQLPITKTKEKEISCFILTNHTDSSLLLPQSRTDRALFFPFLLFLTIFVLLFWFLSFYQLVKQSAKKRFLQNRICDRWHFLVGNYSLVM